MRSEGFPFISWGSGGWRCVRRSWLERPQWFAIVRNRSRCRRLALSLGEALAGDFLWREKVSLCAAIPLWFAWKWYVMQKSWCISLRRRRVSWKWHVCVVVIYWELQFQSGVLEVLNRVVPLGFAVAMWLGKLRFCDKSQVKRLFWRKRARAEVVKIIPNARKSCNFGCLVESDESHFSWQAQHIVDLKVEKGDFAAQAQGFVKVRPLRRSHIGNCSLRVVF